MIKKQNTLEIIKALHSESKLIILSKIFQMKKMNVSRIVEVTRIGRTNVSNHLSQLVKLHVLKVETEGRERFYDLDDSLSKEDYEMIKTMSLAYCTCNCSNGKI